MTPLVAGRPSRSELLQAVGLLLFCTALLYGHTLHAPFYMDDISGIVQNYPLRDLSGALTNLFSQRGLTRLTFAMNLRCSGFSLPALHVINILLHFSCGTLVWLLLRRFFCDRTLPLLGALLFIAHPLQTQGVTYLIQRATALGAFFFLLGVICYLRARDALQAGYPRTSAAWLRPYLCALLAGTCAVLAKENTATLPVVLISLDRLFPLSGQETQRPDFRVYLPFGLVSLCLGVGMVTSGLLGNGEPIPLYYPLSSLQANDPLHYLVTQFSVMWVYLRLLFLPYGQALEYDYPVVAQLFSPGNLIALAGLLLLWGVAWRLRSQRPLLTFGVVWFFLALAVESSVVPLDPLFEHRLYLPMFGFILVLLDVLTHLVGNRRTVFVLGVAILLCAPLTWKRNALWNDPIAFYQDNLQSVPDSERAMLDLSLRYRDADRDQEMGELLERAVRLYPNNAEFHIALADFYAVRSGLQPALALLDDAIVRLPDNVELYETAALIAERYGQKERIFAYLNAGLAKVSRNKWRLLNDLGIYHALFGEVDRAEEAYRQSLAVHADNPVACQYLAALYFKQQRWREAFDLLQTAQRLEPGNPETLNGLGTVAHQLGDGDTARWAEEKLRYSAIGDDHPVAVPVWKHR